MCDWRLLLLLSTAISTRPPLHPPEPSLPPLPRFPSATAPDHRCPHPSLIGEGLYSLYTFPSLHYTAIFKTVSSAGRGISMYVINLYIAVSVIFPNPPLFSLTLTPAALRQTRLHDSGGQEIQIPAATAQVPPDGLWVRRLADGLPFHLTTESLQKLSVQETLVFRLQWEVESEVMSSLLYAVSVYIWEL